VTTSSSAPTGARFDRFIVDFSNGGLLCSGERVPIQGQPLQVLRVLLEAEGKVVAREELRQALWPEDTFVDFELGVNTAVKKLRQALEDSADHPKFIETLPRFGYRFMIPVEWVSGVAADPERRKLSSLHHGVAIATPSARPTRWRGLFTTRNTVIGGLTACALGLSFLYYSHSRRSKTGPSAVTPVVTNVGEKHTPSLSPDRQHLVFAWNGGAGPYFSLYVKLVGTEESIRLTKQTSIDFNPVWSPDGRYIAFCRIVKGGTGIYIIPAMGGVERRIRETHWQEDEFYQVFWYFGRLSWSPDGNLVAYSDHTDSNEPTSIFLLSLDTSEVRRLTSPRGSVGDYNPAFSPDGRTLAFNRGSQGVTSIYTVPVSGGEEQHLVSGVQFGWGLAWTPDGRYIVFAKASWLADAGWLWKIPRGGGEPERLQFGQEAVEPSIQGNRLVYAHPTANINIWRRRLHSLVSAGPSDRFIYSTRMESGPQFSPDGSKIAFESTRSGAYEIWMCRSDGTGVVQLTLFNSSTGTPRWSPDGQQIAFDSRAPGNTDIFVVDSQGGSPRRLTSEPSSEVVPSWSRDGRWIYFASDRTGRHEVWKMPSTGGSPVQVTHHGGFAAFESTDGRFLYYAKGMTVSGLWRIPTNGGEEVEIIRSLEAGHWGYWAVVENGIYYLDTTAKPGIVFLDVNTSHTTRVFDLENRPATQAPGLAVSSTNGTILYTQLDALSRDIMLVENFR
jgi:Tol biopolymer transport system component/DNA-binding winged helix-turn-helix (wHTH) protein